MIGADLRIVAAHLLAAVEAETALSDDSRDLWQVMLSDDPLTGQKGRTERIIGRLGGHYPTTYSRICRTGIPKVSDCTAAIGLCFLAALFDGHTTPSEAAYRLGWASPQSMNRHLQATLGMTTGKFREVVPVPMAREWMLDAVVRPYRVEWERFVAVTTRGRHLQAARARHPSLVAA